MKTSLALAFLLACGTAAASSVSGFDVTILVDDRDRPEYSARGKTYVEAIRGENYAIRMTNPTPYRVGVALSVDGLNTIDASHLSAAAAPKWIIEPYDSMVISGWQVSDRSSRRFFFTGEKHSYGAALGQVENLGLIEAVFYRERRHSIDVFAPRSESMNKDSREREAPSASGAPSSDDYAGTGMGGRTRHEVELVDIDLETTPAATVRIRYEFRPQLVKLGVLPALESPLDRRERARGFAGYCPEP